MINSPPYDRNIDIIKDVEFRKSNISYTTAMRELKEMGKGEVQHYPEIQPADLHKIYANQSSTLSPKSLMQKVQFDIRYYFCRRGSENLHAMTKDTFIIKEINGIEYVCLAAGTLDKNHHENDTEMWGAHMPSRPNDPTCPVTSFKKLLSKLHPLCKMLW